MTRARVHLLQRHLCPRNSLLVETLTQHVGEKSPLFRRLSPTDSEGLVCVLGERLRKVLQEEHGEFQKALPLGSSPSRPGSGCT